MTKFFTALVLIIVMSMASAVCTFAAGNSLPAHYSGTVDYLIDIRNPETIVSTTTNRNCVISAVAVRGTISFKIEDYREFIKLHRLNTFTLSDFQFPFPCCR